MNVEVNMKFVVGPAMLLFLAGLAGGAEFTGYLADAKCAKGGKAASASHSACSAKCVEAGEKIVLVSEDDKIYQIKNQDKVKPHLGHKVALEAKLDGDSLDVETGRDLD
jgi:hypothetical protein